MVKNPPVRREDMGLTPGPGRSQATGHRGTHSHAGRVVTSEEPALHKQEPPLTATRQGLRAAKVKFKK